MFKKKGIHNEFTFVKEMKDYFPKLYIYVHKLLSLFADLCELKSMGGVQSGTHTLGDALWVQQRQKQKCQK